MWKSLRFYLIGTFKFNWIQINLLRPVRRGRLCGDLRDEMQPDLWRNSLPCQQNWLYSIGGGIWDILENTQKRPPFLNGGHWAAPITKMKILKKNGLYSGWEGGFGKMPKGVDWRHSPPANVCPWQTQVILMLASFFLNFDFHSIHSLNKLVAACSDIRVNKEMRSIEVTSKTKPSRWKLKRRLTVSTGLGLKTLVWPTTTLSPRSICNTGTSTAINLIMTTYRSIKLWKNIRFSVWCESEAYVANSYK